MNFAIVQCLTRVAARRDAQIWRMGLHAAVLALLALAVACSSSSGSAGTTGTYVKPGFGSGDATTADVHDAASPNDSAQNANDTAAIADNGVGPADMGPDPDAVADAADTADTADTGGPTPICGDNNCDDGIETCADCPQDCGACTPVCGDKTCDKLQGETCKTCAKDCGVCPPSCGDGTCDPSESCSSCVKDCGACAAQCGDSVCDAAGGETCSNCPFDCKKCATVCGDAKCDAAGGETCSTCPGDCGGPCKICNPLTSENCPAGQQCYVTGAGPKCSAPGSTNASQPCNGDADCLKGNLCIAGVCNPICDTTAASALVVKCNLPGACLELQQTDGTPIGWNLGICVGNDTCNLVTNNGCASGLACYPAGTGGKACATAGKLTAGQPCQYPEDCAAALACVGDGTGAGSLCKLKCNTLKGTMDCGGKTCGSVTIGDPPKTAADNLGVCK